MDYKKKYRDLVEAVKALQEANPSDEGIQNWVEDNVPELKESEDERIRKEITELVMQPTWKTEKEFHRRKELCDWLEKRGEQETLCDKCRKEQPSHSCQDITALGRCAVEHEQKPTDKVEPKFHEGDWVVTSYGKVNQVIAVDKDGDGYTLDDGIYFSGSWCDMYHLWNIQDAKDGDVLATEPIRGYHSPFVAIYKEHGLDFFNSYCFISFDGKFYEANTGHSIEKIHPATKEQREQLEKAMADAGYTFDFEKKELKKVEQTSADETPYPETLEKAIDLYYYSYGNGKGEFEHLSLEKFRDIVLTFVSDYGQKPAWSEEDKKMFRIIGNAITADDASEYLESKGIQVIDAHVWLDELKERVQPQPKQEWSEKDDIYIENIILAVEKQYPIAAKDIVDWLKSLKNRYTWKPSDEQMVELRRVISGCSYDIEPLTEMEEELKKLREEKL